MAGKFLESITYIRSVSKKKTLFDKILAHLSKSDDAKGNWSLEGLDEVVSSMISENAIELVDGVHKI